MFTFSNHMLISSGKLDSSLRKEMFDMLFEMFVAKTTVNVLCCLPSTS